MHTWQVLALAVLALAAPIPTPIGAGPRYTLPPTTHPVTRLHCAGARPRVRAHVELFANGRALLLPPRIGVRPGCSYAVRTTDPTGVVEVVPSAAPTLADLFAVWGQDFGPRRLASFRGELSAWVGGRRWRGDVRRIPLTRHAQIVVEVGGYVPPHARYLFPRR